MFVYAYTNVQLCYICKYSLKYSNLIACFVCCCVNTNKQMDKFDTFRLKTFGPVGLPYLATLPQWQLLYHFLICLFCFESVASWWKHSQVSINHLNVWKTASVSLYGWIQLEIRVFSCCLQFQGLFVISRVKDF